MGSLLEGSFLQSIFKQSHFGIYAMSCPVSFTVQGITNEEFEKKAAESYICQRIVECNEAFANQYSASVEKMLNLTMDEFFEHNASGLNFWKQLLQKETLVFDSNELNRKGERTVIRGTYQLLFNDKNEVIGHFGIQQNVTDEIIQKEKIQDYQNKIDILLESGNEAIWDWNVKEDSLRTSDSWFTMLGYSADELIPSFETWMKLVHPDDFKGANTKFQSYLQQNAIEYDAEFRMLRKDGTYAWILSHGRAVEWDKDGNPIRIIGRHLEISKLKEAEERAHESEELLKVSLDAGGQGYWQWDVQTDYCYYSDKWYDLIDYPEWKGRTDIQIWEDSVHPLDKEDVQTALNDHFAGKTDVYKSEHRIRSKHGQNIWILDQGVVIERDSKGNPVRMVGTFTDISPFKEQEAKFNLTLEGGALGLWEYDLEKQESIFHESWLNMHGFKDDKRHVPYSFWESLVHPDDVASVKEQLTKYIHNEIPKFIAEYRIKNAHNQYVWVLDQGEIVKYNADGKPLTLFGTHLVIDEQKQREVELSEMVTLRDKLMDILSHDLKSPVANIIGLTDIMTQTASVEVIGAETLKMVDLLGASAKQLNEILTNMLLWSRVKGNRIQFVPETFSLGYLLDKSIQQVDGVSKTKEIHIEYSLQELGKVNVLTDKNLFQIILHNLLTNAIKFTPRNGRIQLKAVSQEDGDLLSVIDSGIGMSKEKANTLFVPGKNQSTIGTEGEKGTGLGMLIIADFMRMHGGTIEVDSTEGSGTTFKLFFPK